LTILIGFKYNEEVMLTADNLSSTINNDGTFTGETSHTDKISLINPKVLIATAGVSQIGAAVKNTLLNTIYFNQHLNKDQIVTFVQQTLNFCHNQFKAANPQVEYLDLAAIIAGKDEETDNYYLYSFSSVDNFSPVECTNDGYFVVAPNSEVENNIKSYLRANLNRITSSITLASLLSEAIRNVNCVDVSKDTLSMSFTRQLSLPNYRCIRIDEEGNLLGPDNSIVIPYSQIYN